MQPLLPELQQILSKEYAINIFHFFRKYVQQGRLLIFTIIGGIGSFSSSDLLLMMQVILLKVLSLI